MKKIRKILCVFFGHPKIVELGFGYVHCARCEEQIGDRVAGCFDLTNYFIVGHENCKECKVNYEKLTFWNKLLTPTK